VNRTYASVGVYIGTHSATDQYNTLRAENRLVPLSQRQPGDILWYSNGGSTSAIKYHVTLYIGNGEMIEAPYPGVGVRIAAVRFGDLVPYAGRPTG
jgi:cell wall-associated NlpC family hydrolase